MDLPVRADSKPKSCPTSIIDHTHYHQAGVPLYVIVDARPSPRGRRVKLHGFSRGPEGYEPLPLDDEGRLRIEALNLWMAIAEDRVVCIDGRTGEPIAGFAEQIQARAEAQAYAAEAQAQAAEAEARNREMEARNLELMDEIRRLRGEA